MAPAKGVRTISQEAFDELVRENTEDLDMDPVEALQDAIETLTLQGVDLSGIITCVPGENSVKENPVMQCLDRLRQLASVMDTGLSSHDLEELLILFNTLVELFSEGESTSAAIATKNGALELVCSVCSKIPKECRPALVSCLKAMSMLIHDLQCTEIFRNSGGPKMVIGILNHDSVDSEILSCGFAVVAAAATSNEVVKEAFIELKVDELIMDVLGKQSKTTIEGLYEAIRVLLTPDDNRVLASQVYGYARRFAKVGIARALTESLHSGLSSPSLVSACIALKAVAVNDEICKSIAESGGIDAVLQCIDDSGQQGNQITALTCCSLLSKLAGSDSNKNSVVEKRGMDRLINLAAKFADDPSVLQEVMSTIAILCLRSPENASRAIEAGAGDLAIQAMREFPAAQQMQKSSCLMIRNLVVRNPENRTLLLGSGVEKYIRKVKENHKSCKNYAVDALRDLGIDNYNS